MMRLPVTHILHIRVSKFRVAKSLRQGHKAWKACTDQTPAPKPTPTWLTQLRGISSRVPDSTPQRARHGPASLPPLVPYTRYSTLSCCSLLPCPCWIPIRPLAGLPLTPKGGQGSLQLRPRGVDEGAPGDLTSTEGTEGCGELWLILPATCLQPPVPIPVGMEQGQSLGVLAQEAQGPQGAARDGPGQVAKGAVPGEGRRTPQNHSQEAQHPQQHSQNPHSSLTQPNQIKPPGCLPLVAHEAAAQRLSGNGIQ